MSKANLKNMVEMARVHVENGGIRAAEVYYRMILKASDTLTDTLQRMAAGEACAFFAARSIADGRHGAACDWYQRAVIADPLGMDNRINYIVRALLPMGMFKTAKIHATTATQIEPDSPDAWRALAIACSGMGEVEQAADAYDRQVELDPDNPLAKIDRATLAINVGDYVTARKMAEAVIDTDKRGEALHTLALIAYRESRHEKAIELYDAAIEAGVQDDEQVRWNKSLACHAIGRYAEGWELHEARGRQQADQAMRLVMNRFAQPRLEREDLDGPPLIIHVHQEMGNGDAIATARYLDLLVERGHEVRLETMPSMVSLLQRSFPKVEVMERAIDYPFTLGTVPRGKRMFDKQITTLSLPYLFGTTVETVPWRKPYLRPDPTLSAHYANRLLPRSVLRKVGLCWSSGIRTDGLWISRYGAAKSMNFKQIRGLIQPVEQQLIDFISLQVGPERDQHKGYIFDVLPAKPNWDETAALVANLDIVVTVDTAVAHLAGAMGKPTLLMMQQDGASWHFMCERPGALWNDRSPWYPNCRIFRQKTRGDWSSVLEEVSRELRKCSVGSLAG